MIKNPILPGFNPDPCVCRKKDDYYIAVSSFEWFPAIPIYHSRDLKNWELLTNIIQDEELLDLRKLPSAKGIWAPDLTYSEKEDLFYMVYGVMNSMNARYFDIDNYVITAKDIKGPWSEPVYLHSAGFDAAMFHDDDGRKYVVSLDWETRENYEKPGEISISEYDPVAKRIKSYSKRFWKGGTDRGCIEAPRITRRNGYYYIMCAEGGTGYNHCVTMGRAKNIFGPYEKDPKNPIVTSAPGESYERHDADHLKPKYYNPTSILQKSGHGSYVELPTGEVYLFHLTARPFVTEDNDIRSKFRCTLGRETAMQKMQWTEDGWLRMADGSNLAKENVQESGLKEYVLPKPVERDDFDGEELGDFYYAPRISPKSFCSMHEGWLSIRGQEALTSLNRVSLLCRKLTSLKTTVTTKMRFVPEVFQHSAGLVVYYDNMNYAVLRKYYSETLGGAALMVQHMENGERHQWLDERVRVSAEEDIFLKMRIDGRNLKFAWSYDDNKWNDIGPTLDTSKFSDEYCKFGEFTGAMVGITCEDRVFREKTAEFDFFEVVNEK